MMHQTKAERERDKALLSLNRDKILSYCLKYRIPLADPDEKVFWRSVHKARLHTPTLPESARRESAYWLRHHGYPVGY